MRSTRYVDLISPAHCFASRRSDLGLFLFVFVGIFFFYAVKPFSNDNDACATNYTFCEAPILKENVELRAQLELLTTKYGKLEESHKNLSSSNEYL
jgi:hypothetical protein